MTGDDKYETYQRIKFASGLRSGRLVESYCGVG